MAKSNREVGIRVGLVVLCSVLVLFLSVGHARPIKVLFVGNSITASANGKPSFRFFVWEELEKLGYDRESLDFIGSYCGVDEAGGSSCGHPLFDTSQNWWDWNHFGYYGAKTFDMHRFLPSIIPGELPDVVVVHLGTNDLIEGYSAAVTSQRLGAVLDTIRKYSDNNVTFLLSRIVPLPERSDSVVKYNALVEEVAESKSRSDSHAYTVDLFTDYDSMRFFDIDRIHPNAEGEEFMGLRMAPALSHILDSLSVTRCEFVEPPSQEWFRAGEDLTLEAVVRTIPGTKSLEFFANGSSLGGGVPIDDSAYSLSWTNIRPGVYSLYAAGVDSLDCAFSSDTVRIAVVESPMPVTRTIPEIQGSGLRSPHYGTRVRTAGIVTGVHVDSTGFWMQTVTPDASVATSEGVFVTLNSSFFGIPCPGDEVYLTGTVDELYNSPKLTMTTIAFVDTLRVQSTQNPIPTPTYIPRLPRENSVVARAWLEWVEGMLVTIIDSRVVGSASENGEFSMVTGNGKAEGSGLHSCLYALAVEKKDGSVDYNPERIHVGSQAGADIPTVSNRDEIVSVTGIMNYRNGAFYLEALPDSIAIGTQVSLPSSPARRTGPRGRITFATFDFVNMYDSIEMKDRNSGAQTPSRIAARGIKFADAVANEMLFPQLISLQGIENEDILRELTDRIRDRHGKEYAFHVLESVTENGLLPAFLVDSQEIRTLDVYLLPGREADAAFGLSTRFPTARPLVGEFRLNGMDFMVINMDLIDKKIDQPLMGVNVPPFRGSEPLRKRQAQAIRGFVDSILEVDSDVALMILGDLNDFPFGEYGEGEEHPYAILKGFTDSGQVVLTDPFDGYPAGGAFTDIVQGNAQHLKHVFLSPALARILIGGDILHINSLFPDAFMDDTTNVYRSSSSDPVEIRF